MEHGRELQQLTEHDDALLSKLKKSIVAKLTNLNLKDPSLNHFIRNIDHCDTKLAIIQQLYQCYVQFKPTLKSKELSKTISVPNTIRRILAEDFGITEDLTKPKATTEALFHVLQQLHHEQQKEQQKAIHPPPTPNPLNLSYQELSIINADLYHAQAKQVHYDSGVDKMPAAKAKIAEQLAHLLAGSFAAAHGKAAGFESIAIAQNAIRLEMDKQDPSLAIVVDPEKLAPTARTSASTAGERRIELAKLPVYQILYQGQPTNVLLMSRPQADAFIAAAKYSPQAINTATHEWRLDKIHPDPIEMSINILRDLAKNIPGFFKPYQEIAALFIANLIDRTLTHKDPETFKNDLTSTVNLLKSFLTDNNISAKPFISALKTAKEKCEERFAVIARAKEELPRPK